MHNVVWCTPFELQRTCEPILAEKFNLQRISINCYITYILESDEMTRLGVGLLKSDPSILHYNSNLVEGFRIGGMQCQLVRSNQQTIAVRVAL